MNIDLYGLTQPAVIVSNDYGFEYTNQTSGVSCKHKTLKGILYPIYVNKKYDDLFNPKKNYLKFNFNKNKSEYIKCLQTNWNLKFGKIYFVDSICEEAWLPFIFTSTTLFSQEYSQKDRYESITRKMDMKKFNECINNFETIKDDSLDKEINEFIKDSSNHFYYGVLTWKNCD